LVVLAAPAAALAADTAPAPIDPQNWTWQDELTWNDYKKLPGPDYSDPSIVPPMTSKRGRVVYKITAEGKERFADLLAQAGPETYDDAGFGVHFAFFARTDQATRLRILEGRRRRIEERREGLREVLSRAGERLDAYTLELQRHGLDACEREVRWLEELITNERSGRAPATPGSFDLPAAEPQKRVAGDASPQTPRPHEDRP